MTAYDENRRLRDELTVRRALRVRLTHYIVGLSDRVLCLFVISAVVLFAAMAAVAAVGALT